MALEWPFKDPDEVLDYQIDWAPRLDGDTITTSTWLVPSGLTKGAETNTSATTTVWLSGGAVGSYDITNRIITNGGRTMDQTVRLKVKAR